MKRFLKNLFLFIGVPLVVLLGIYLCTDPFRCIHPFDINDTDITNREYLSTELFLRNEKRWHYNSFIFSSSRGCGMNTYRWKTYLPNDARPFIFQAWGETLTGIELKMDYLDKNDVRIDNALILLDIPSTFNMDQLPRQALSMKHFVFTGKTKFAYSAAQFFNFIQKPSLWFSSIKKSIRQEKEPCCSDTISNDWEKGCRVSYTEIPDQDSLRGCSEQSKQTFLTEVAHRGNEEIEVSEPLINNGYEVQMRHIKSIFDRQGTDYYVILTPAYCYTHPSVNPKDLEKLNAVFGEDRVYNYTGKNKLTIDYNNYSDPNHFGQRVGWLILEDIYGGSIEY